MRTIGNSNLFSSLFLLLLAAGCSGVARAPAPASMPPPAEPVAIMPSPSRLAEPGVVQDEAPVTKISATVPPERSAAKPRTTPGPSKPQLAPALDLKTLEARLKNTKAIGVFTKITLKNQVDDLLNQFRAYYQGRIKTSLTDLRQPYDRLLLKVLTLLQDDDPELARAIMTSREAIWSILADPAKFASL